MLAPMKSFLSKPQIGVSLVEVMVTLAIIGILLSIAAPSFADLLDRHRVQMMAAELSTDLADARAEAGLRPSVVDSRQNAIKSCYTIYYVQPTGACNCTQNQICSLQTPELKTVQVPASAGGIDAPVTSARSGERIVSFSSLRMMSSPPEFAVHVTGTRGAKLRVRTNAAGRISICSPPGSSMSGVKPC